MKKRNYVGKTVVATVVITVLAMSGIGNFVGRNSNEMIARDEEYIVFREEMIVLTEATDSTIKATEWTTEATDSMTEATEPTTEATELTTMATEPTTEATEPTTEATEPTTEVTEPTTEATELTTMATEEITESTTIPELAVKVKLSEIDSKSNTSDRIWSAFDFLISNGFTPEAASGVIGNIAVESTFDTTADNGHGFHGLCQWNTCYSGAYWWNKITAYLDENDYDKWSYEGQMNAILFANRGQMTDARLEELKQMEDPQMAAEYFAVYYEACTGGSSRTVWFRKGHCYQDLNLRKSEAQEAYRMYVEGDTEYKGKKAYNG